MMNILYKVSYYGWIPLGILTFLIVAIFEIKDPFLFKLYIYTLFPTLILIIIVYAVEHLKQRWAEYTKFEKYKHIFLLCISFGFYGFQLYHNEIIEKRYEKRKNKT